MNYADKHKALVEYLKVKTAEGDWHGVSDAANDLRVLEAERPAVSPILREIREPFIPCGSPRNFRTFTGRCALRYGHVGECCFV